MKTLLGASLMTTSVVATGVLLLVASGEVAVALAVESQVGPDTPISGLTIGGIIAGIVFGFGFMFQGGKYLVQLGVDLARWKAALDDASKFGETVERVADQVRDNNERLAVLERWQRHIDPILAEHRVRLGLRNKDKEA